MTQTTIYKGENAVFLALPEKKPLEAAKEQKPMIPEKKGKTMRQTIVFRHPVCIRGGASVVTEREAEGPIGHYFDTVVTPKQEEKNFELSEIRMLKTAVESAIAKSGLTISDIDLLLAGDLLNQITSSSFVARDLGIPYMGVYSACSTMSQALAVGAMLIDGGHYETVCAATASHFATAERQYRYPLEYGAQRPPYAQWTVTGAGCSVLSTEGTGPRIQSATIGKVVDFGVDDIANMGAAMAPAAMDTLYTLFRETNTKPADYDLILTGDLGKLGSDILRDLMQEQGYFLGQNYTDCGCLIYDVTQKVYQGGSGAGCSASVFNSYILKLMNEGKYNRIAFLATGALMSPQSANQGETIPCISHAVVIENNQPGAMAAAKS